MAERFTSCLLHVFLPRRKCQMHGCQLQQSVIPGVTVLWCFLQAPFLLRRACSPRARGQATGLQEQAPWTCQIWKLLQQQVESSTSECSTSSRSYCQVACSEVNLISSCRLVGCREHAAASAVVCLCTQPARPVKLADPQSCSAAISAKHPTMTARCCTCN
jgi:hypothetical protein